ncbi:MULTISPECIES: hypothetical protein [Methylorubrum]|nr:MULTISPECIES: hypothetical protein [Methylorubrum]MCP1547257.1 hypothetical protein [Methylorubrum zatmanii]MCP1556127.1 hypothetical protein [Methylorubrum extorquens]MCP1577560.1 hypothetical protein [Methylorubrum extorquens]
MVTEKVKAAGEAAMTIAMGGTPRKVVRGYPSASRFRKRSSPCAT